MTLAAMPDPAALSGAKWAFTTRRVPQDAARGLSPDLAAARPGDLLAARVTRIGSHRRLQTREGRHSALFEDDLVVLACGDRFAVDQFEGRAELPAEGCDLLAGGGVAGVMECRNGRVAAPTQLRPLGLITGADGRAINLCDHALPRGRGRRPAVVIGVVGSGMNAGKTDATAWLARGLTRAGARTAGIKATGTGAFGDVHAYADAGAAEVLDFTDAGLASTYRQAPERLEAALDDLLDAAAARGCDAAVVEFADGVTQAETAALLASGALGARVDGVIFAAADPLSALGGLRALEAHDLAPLAVSGVLARAPLAVRELEAASGAWVLGREALADPACAAALRSLAEAARAAALKPGRAAA